MIKKTCLEISVVGCLLSLLLLLAACEKNSDTMPSPNVQVKGTVTATGSKTDFAATVGSIGPVNRDAQGQNLTTIHSAVDRPVAKFTETTLNVPPRARGVVYIQNDSANPQTLVADTANSFPTFTIPPYSSRELVFHRAGTFKAHLKDYAISADTTLMVIITVPFVLPPSK